MKQRIEYKLSQNTRETAKNLIQYLKQGHIDQNFELVDVTAGSGVRSREYKWGLGADESHEVPTPSLAALYELAKYNLIRLVEGTKIQVTLFQTLQDAVENNFFYFREIPYDSLAGTIIYGNLTISEGAVFSSSGYGNVTVTVTMQTLPDELYKLLGEDAKRENIAAALNDLKEATDSTRLKKAGRVIEELGRSLEHLSNAGGALAALALIVRLFGGV